MSKSVNDWVDDFDNRPVGTTFKGCFIVILALAVLGGVGGTISYFGGWFSEGASVAQEELGPRALLEKYAWFKNAAASLDKKSADIALYKQRVADFEASYGATPRHEWDRTDKEEWSQINAELLGVRASYNSLAADYNAQMAKINWAFANAGQVPAGGEPLPREFRVYEQ